MGAVSASAHHEGATAASGRIRGVASSPHRLRARVLLRPAGIASHGRHCTAQHIRHRLAGNLCAEVLEFRRHNLRLQLVPGSVRTSAESTRAPVVPVAWTLHALTGDHPASVFARFSRSGRPLSSTPFSRLVAHVLDDDVDVRPK